MSGKYQVNFFSNYNFQFAAKINGIATKVVLVDVALLVSVAHVNAEHVAIFKNVNYCKIYSSRIAEAHFKLQMTKKYIEPISAAKSS